MLFRGLRWVGSFQAEWLTTTYDSRSRASATLFWPSRALTNMWHIHAQTHKHLQLKIKPFKIRKGLERWLRG